MTSCSVAGSTRSCRPPGGPALWESHVRDARTYVELAERRNGVVPRPVAPSWPWGHALEVLAAERPDARIVNLETSITVSDDAVPGKSVHYRMHPDNLAALRAVAPDVTTLANNHVLDFGPAGLVETLDVLDGAGLATAGAGHDAPQAHRPAVVDLAGGRRVVVIAIGTPSSGIPPTWAATTGPGVALVPEPTPAAADAVLDGIRRIRRPGDVVVASVHWGSNWGYALPDDHVAFGHALVEGGVDLVCGHSSHHPRPVEPYGDGLVLHGCGDLVNDYEGIGGHEDYRSDLRLLYLARVDVGSGRVVGLRMVPLQARRLRLEPAGDEDVASLADTLDRVSRPLGARVARGPDDVLTMEG